MDQTLLKYWKTCLQDAERKAIALKGPRITLNIGDKILKFIPLKSIPVIFPDWKAEDSVDIVINQQTLENSQKAQIEDIAKRKTGVTSDKITINVIK